MIKEFKLSGIYKITNKINGKFYVGSSNSIFGRWLNHASWITNDTHNNYKLSRAVKKYGLENFSFEILEIHPTVGLNAKEQHYLDTLCKAQEYINGESNFFVTNTYNIKPKVEGIIGISMPEETIIRALRTRGYERIYKVSSTGAVIDVYEMQKQAAEDNDISRVTVSKSIQTKKCPKHKDFYFVYESDYDSEFIAETYQVHNKGQKGVQTYESQWKEVFCYDVYGRFFKKFESGTATAKYFNTNTSSVCRMINTPKKKILHRHGIHLYNLHSEKQEEKENLIDLLKNKVSDGNIEVFTLFHEPLGEFSKETISSVLECHLHSISQAITQNKILKGFYFIRD